MVVCKSLEGIKYFDESALTMGSLDGMHSGHVEVISYLKTVANTNNVPSVVITFDPLPKEVLRSDKKFIHRLLSMDKKMEILAKYSIDYVWVIPFDKKFSQLSADEFMNKYISAYFNPIDIIVGYDHHFGFNREGNKEFLDNNKKEYGYRLHIIKPKLYLDRPISSSRISKYLKSGNIDMANECLGWKYEFSGVIVKGQGIGTKLKFPTANIEPHIPGQLLPAHGVYCVDIFIEDIKLPGMCNIGKRPTFYENGEEIIEVHIFSQKALKLYDKEIAIKFKKFLREEKKYSSIKKLTKQLELDRQECFV